MKPFIGVIPLFDEDKDSIWMVPGYLSGIEEAGGIPIILPYTTDAEEISAAASMCQGFLFTGGHDVDPALYNEEKKSTCGTACHVRDVMEKQIFDIALREDKPVFGICRGIQLINALCGGTLYQDLPSEYECKVEHHMEPPYDRACHQVRLVEDELLAKWFGKNELGVNSYHHQAIKELAGSLKALAYSEDGLVEAVYRPTSRFVMAVQWHPEFNYRVENTSRIMFEKFIEACGQ